MLELGHCSVIEHLPDIHEKRLGSTPSPAKRKKCLPQELQNHLSFQAENALVELITHVN
jgi:hypothetical protein